MVVAKEEWVVPDRLEAMAVLESLTISMEQPIITVVAVAVAHIPVITVETVVMAVVGPGETIPLLVGQEEMLAVTLLGPVLVMVAQILAEAAAEQVLVGVMEMVDQAL